MDVRQKINHWKIIFMIVAVWMMAMAVFPEMSHAAVVKENARGTSIRQNLGSGSDGKSWMNPHYKTVPQYLFTIKTGNEEKYGYCFQTGKIFSDKHSYIAKQPPNASAWTNLATSRQRIIRLAMYYGYNNGKAVPVSGANSNDYYAATQVLVWEASDGDISLSSNGKWSKSTNKHDDLISGRTGATKCYNWIKNRISEHVKGPSFCGIKSSDAPTYTMKYDYTSGKWKTEITDTRSGNYYRMQSGQAGGINMDRKEYAYTFTSSNAGTKLLSLMNSDSDGTSQELMVFKPSNSGKQAIVIGSSDNTYFYMKLRTENEGTGTIIKRNSDGSRPGGFRFLIENHENGYSCVHETDEGGTIDVQLYPGEYTVTELLSEEQQAAGFTEPVGGKLKITEGGHTVIELENVRKTVPFQIKKTADGGNIEGFRFIITDSEGRECFSGVTDSKGAITGELYPGEYTVSEQLSEAQICEGYVQPEPQKLTVSSQLSAIQTIKFHNQKLPVEGRIAIYKTTDDGGTKKGFSFRIEGVIERSGEKYMKTDCTTDENGWFLSENVEPGTYTVTEIMSDEQKERYLMSEEQIVQIAEGGQGAVIHFENKAKMTSVSVNKKSEDGNVREIGFSVTGKTAWGETVERNIETNEKGQADVKLSPGTYEITEKEASVEGYKRQDPVEVTITGDEDRPVVITFVNIPNAILFEKTEILENGMVTDTPVEGAVYRVYKEEIIGDKLVQVDFGRFETDVNGSFTVKGVSPGKYYFKEIAAPIGYERSEEPVVVIFKENDAGIKVEGANKRARGTITVNIRDNQGNPVEATEMGLYIDEDCTSATAIYSTDDNGRFKIDDLPWGEYYLKEIKTTRGYEENDEIRKVVIGKDGVTDAEINILKEQKRGSVVITKTDGTGEFTLEGAEFSLYRTDGGMVGQGLRTDEDGKLLLEDLEWGSYYLQETKAPQGYGLEMNPVRFSVNATTGGLEQELSMINEVNASAVIINKKIRREDLHYDHGIPTFTFVLTGTTVDGENIRYVRQAVFSEQYVRDNCGNDGYILKPVVFDGLKAGHYTCREKKSIRYELDQVTGMSSNAAAGEDGKTVEFDLAGLDTGTAVFVNKKTEWQGYSDSLSVTNIIKAEKKLTALAVEYLGDDQLDGNMPFSGEEFLEVTAYYDDGSELALSSEQYKLISGDGTVMERTPETPGEYTVSVWYEDGGVSRSGNFSFRITGVTELTVTFETNGGTKLEPVSVWKYDRLIDRPEEKYHTEKDGYRFAGWFSDPECTEIFLETAYIKDNMTLYAGWEKMHLEDYTWEQIREISENGNAQDVFGECLEAIQEDLSDDGQILPENYMHMKAFTCGDAVCHAMIAGFGQDTSPGGEPIGITFLSYELMEEKAMITAETGRESGWSTSHMRNVVMPEIYEKLPEAMKGVLSKAVKTDIEKKGTDILVEETEDLIWLPSQTELYGAWGYDMWDPKTASAEKDDPDYGELRSVDYGGSQYQLFYGIVPDGVDRTETAITMQEEYWTRSPDPGLDRGFCTVDLRGAGSSR